MTFSRIFLYCSRNSKYVEKCGGFLVWSSKKPIKFNYPKSDNLFQLSTRFLVLSSKKCDEIDVLSSRKCEKKSVNTLLSKKFRIYRKYGDTNLAQGLSKRRLSSQLAIV